jgi:Na+-driven multidrug efflux pump
MISMVIGTGLNLILDPIFIFGFGMGIRGAAIATVISIFMAAVYIVLFYARGKSNLHFTMSDIRIHMDILPEMVKIGSSSLGRMIGGSLLAIVLNNSVAYYGQDIHLAAVGAVNRLLIFLFLPIIGLVQGLQPILGFNYGSEKMDRVKGALFTAARVATVYSIMVFAVVMLFAEPLLTMFSTDKALIRTGGTILRTITLMVPFAGFQVVGASLFQALGKAIPAFFLSSSRQLLFLVPFILLFPMFFRLMGVWIAYPVADTLSTLITAIWVAMEIKHLKKRGLQRPVHEPETALEEAAVQ